MQDPTKERLREADNGDGDLQVQKGALTAAEKARRFPQQGPGAGGGRRTRGSPKQQRLFSAESSTALSEHETGGNGRSAYFKII